MSKVALSRMHQIQCVFLVLLILSLFSCAQRANERLTETVKETTEPQTLQDSKHKQLVLVISDDWQAQTGLLYRFEKVSGQWQPKGSLIQVTLGRTGLAWGLGLHAKQQGQVKKEGDGKAPAGVFTLGDAFGYLPQLNTGLAYQEMTANDFCIDVNASPYYNQIVSTLDVGKQAVSGSSEPMRRDIHLAGDDKYGKGLIVQHNVENISGSGSCIFMHIWHAATQATAGCTAMSDLDITELLAWLTAEKQPLYVALPKSEYLAKKLAWAIPDLPLAQ